MPSRKPRSTRTGRRRCLLPTSSTSSTTTLSTRVPRRLCSSVREEAHRSSCRDTSDCGEPDGDTHQVEDIMLICVPGILSKDDVAEFRHIMDSSDWEDGRSTAGSQSAMVKRNEQLPPDSEVARKLGPRIISAMPASPRFLAAAIPQQIFPPLFNRYSAESGHHFGIHVDNAVRGDK